MGALHLSGGASYIVEELSYKNPRYTGGSANAKEGPTLNIVEGALIKRGPTLYTKVNAKFNGAHAKLEAPLFKRTLMHIEVDANIKRGPRFF